jgi:hypothetical protein
LYDFLNFFTSLDFLVLFDQAKSTKRKNMIFWYFSPAPALCGDQGKSMKKKALIFTRGTRLRCGWYFLPALLRRGSRQKVLKIIFSLLCVSWNL